MSKLLKLLDHHSNMLGYIESVRQSPWIYFWGKYEGKNDLTVEEAVEIYMTEVIDRNLCYRTANPEIREQYKHGILLAVSAEKKGVSIKYLPDSTPSGDIICQGCVQFRMERPDFPGCVRRIER